MNVLLISREFPPFFGGGIGTYTRQFVFALTAAGHRAVVVTVSDDGRERREDRGGVAVVRLPFLQGDDWSGPHPAITTPETVAAFKTFAAVSVFAMQVANALPRLVEEFAIDVVEAPDTGALAWFALNARRTGSGWGEAGPPLVTVVHSPTKWVSELNHEPTEHRRRTELILMERDSARWSDGLVCPSAALAGWAQREWQTGPVAVVPYPLGDMEVVARSVTEGRKQAGSPRPKRIVFVGRLEPRKGVSTLLRAFARAIEGGADLRLDLVGQDTVNTKTGSPFGAPLIAALPEQVRERVTMRGRMPSERIHALVGGGAAVVVPSPADNYPYACIEAMAGGKTVIASRAGGMAELIRDGVDGLLVEPGDVEAWARAFGRIGAASEADLRAMGRAAAFRVLGVCGNEAVVRARVEHYQSIIQSGRNRRASAADTPIVLVNTAGDADAGPLLRAAVMPGIDFAHGWPRLPDGTVLPFGTPSVESLARSPRRMGPMAVRRAAIDDPGVRSRVPVSDVGPGRARVPSTWELAVALCRAGFSGAVVPECVVRLGASPKPGVALSHDPDRVG